MVIADLVLQNGKVATVDNVFSFCEAVAVKDGWIIDLGTTEDMKGHIGPCTEVIDLEGKVMLPAANDAHLHATLTGLRLREGFLDLGAAQSLADLKAAVAEAVKTAKPGQWIWGSGFMEFMYSELQAQGMRGINRWDLDEVAPDVPVMLNDFGLHTLVVNSKALELAGITKESPDLKPEEGIMERDPATGEPNGRFFEWSAHHLIGNHCPPVSDEEIEQSILRVQHALNAQGATSHVDIVGRGVERIFLGVSRERCMEIYERMSREGKLTARVSLHINPCVDGVESYDSIMQAMDEMKLPEFRDPNWVQAKTIKIFGDQGLWLRPREDRPNGEGRSVFPGQTDEEQAEELRRTIIGLHRRGWQVGIHALGGKTIDVAAGAYMEAQQMYPREQPRHFIIHGDDMTEEAARKMGRFGIGCSPQPIAANIVAGMNAPHMTAGEELFNWEAYMKAGCWVSGGSDSPCFDFNWRSGVQFAVTRTTVMGQAIRPDLAMSLENAIRMYTINGAFQEHMEHVRGSIEIGKVADSQVLGRDIFTCPTEEIGQIPVNMTICGGKIVYQL